MSKLQGKNLKVEIIGESHSPEMKLKVKGFPNFSFDKDELLKFLERRKATNSSFAFRRI